MISPKKKRCPKKLDLINKIVKLEDKVQKTR